MNVASLELCKELWRFSGWEDTPLSFQDNPLMGKEWAGARNGIQESPAYSLGYLLRKLPRYELKSNGIITWIDYYDTETDGFVSGEAKTPEDAACKLAIELFKQKVLTKEDTK